MATQINAWWWRPRKGKNFGDEMGALMLKHMGYKLKRVALDKADLVCVGTIMETVESKAKDGIAVWGAGVGHLHEGDNRFNILALRGKVSAMTYNANVPLGDPALLVSRFYTKQPYKYNVGVVRHYVDTNDYPWADVVIDAMEPVEDVIAKISSCRTICSSSLHGLIVAQSFGIPAMRIDHPEVISGDIKWLDYQTALDRPLVQIQEELIGAFNESFSSR